MALFNQLYDDIGFPDGGVIIERGLQETSPPADGPATSLAPTGRANAAASTAMMVVLLVMVIGLAIFFCCM